MSQEECRTRCIQAAATYYSSQPLEGEQYTIDNLILVAERFYRWVTEEQKQAEGESK